ncbi:histidyl-tRNA synthetase, putative [Eimeria praecox]|uniref:histidine--tRNA ligase n=1 Tax=Eimeria praecox TaxID=51316 RepID=U6H1D4_9EIME|nr:histidyl-tRNA synthetase, putative [Eimeria praecox]
MVEHFLYDDKPICGVACSVVTKRSPVVLASHTRKEPLFVSPPQRLSFDQNVEANTQEVSSQDAPKSTLLPPRGFRDFPPDVLAVHNHIFSCWHEVAAEFGFVEYKGPSVERYSLYSPFCHSMPTSAPSSRDASPLEAVPASPAASYPPHIYLLQLGGPESLCLRPELTPSLSRMLQRQQLQHPSGIARRWYSVERVWRHEKPGCGRRREHFQWNLDIALPFPSRRNSFKAPDTADAAQQTHGTEGQGYRKKGNMESAVVEFCSFAAAELIAAAIRLLQKLGLSSRDVRIRVGSRSLLRDLLWTDEELRRAGTSVSLPSVARLNQTPGNGPLTHATRHSSPAHDGRIFEQRLTTALQVLDRASRRSQEKTEWALAEGLGITVEKARRVLQRLQSFDINSDAMVRELGRKLQGFGECSGTQHRDDDKLHNMGNQMPLCSGNVLPSGVPASVKDLQRVVHLLKEGYGVGEWVDVDLLIVRGLHYYTGVVFEAFDSEGVFRAIFGGGCYGEPGSSYAGIDAEAEGPSLSTEGPEIPMMHLNTRMLNSHGTMRAAVTGAGLGMGDCVLMALLGRKGLLPSPGPSVDVIVALRQNLAAKHPPGKVLGVPPQYAPRLPDADDSKGKSHYSTLSPTGALDRLFIAAEQLCCKLRSLGLRVELLLPPQRPEKTTIKHASSVGAKAVIFVIPRAQQVRALEVDTKRSEGAAEASPSLPAGVEETTEPTEFKVLVDPKHSGDFDVLAKQDRSSQALDPIPFHHNGANSLKRAKTLCTMSSVVEFLKAHLCPSSQRKQPLE